jgi:hypothetical protein
MKRLAVAFFFLCDIETLVMSLVRVLMGIHAMSVCAFNQKRFGDNWMYTAQSRCVSAEFP